jgi:hypothetical protein
MREIDKKNRGKRHYELDGKFVVNGFESRGEVDATHVPAKRLQKFTNGRAHTKCDKNTERIGFFAPAKRNNFRLHWQTIHQLKLCHWTVCYKNTLKEETAVECYKNSVKDGVAAHVSVSENAEAPTPVISLRMMDSSIVCTFKRTSLNSMVPVMASCK